jgi:glycosyltransferase involved in cell wall biosynthesis
MRIAIVNWTDRKVGGAESYIERAAAGLTAAGHDTALLCEVDLPENRAVLQMPAQAPTWCASTLGSEPALQILREWHPDVVYGHGMLDPKLESATIRVAPAAFFAHAYYGACITGAKTFKRPNIEPCSRRFGWQCLAHYYPHRCGGLNPLTMWTSYRMQAKRFTLLRLYKAIITASAYVRLEYVRLGLAPDSVHVIPLPVNRLHLEGVDEEASEGRFSPRDGAPPERPHRLVFVGRMDPLKGGGILLDALPLMLGSTEGSLHTTFVGDGSERHKWEEKAARIQACEPRLTFEFVGWLDELQLERIFRKSDLVVMPSLWPEPFGLVGPEAGLYGLPTVAFTVGGIPEWLIDGCNGHLAAGSPATPDGLAAAVSRCLDPLTYRNLQRGALDAAQRFGLSGHVTRLADVLQEVAGRSPTAGHRSAAAH